MTETAPDFREELRHIMMGPLDVMGPQDEPGHMALGIINAVTNAVARRQGEKEIIAYSFSKAMTEGLHRPTPLCPENTGYVSYEQRRFLSEMKHIVAAHPFLEAAVNDAVVDTLSDFVKKPKTLSGAIALLNAYRTNGFAPLAGPPFSLLRHNLETMIPQIEIEYSLQYRMYEADVGRLFIELDHQPRLTVKIDKSVAEWMRFLCRKGSYNLVPAVVEHLNTRGKIYQQISSNCQERGLHLIKPNLLIGQTRTGLPLFYDAAYDEGEPPAEWLETSLFYAETLGVKKDLVAIHAPFALAYLARQLKETDPTKPLAGDLEAEMVSIFNTASKTGLNTPKIRRRLVWAAHSGIDPNEQRRTALQARAPKPAPQLKLIKS